MRVLRSSLAIVVAALSACPAPTPEPEPPARCQASTVAPTPSDATRGVLVVLAGEGGPGYADGAFARSNGVGGLARAGDGVVLSDIFNGTLRGLDVDAGTMTTIAGFPLDLGAVDGGCGEARFNGPRGITVDPRDADVVWFGDGPCLRRADLGSGAVTTIAGDCSTPGNDDDVLADARFGFLFHDVEVGADGRVFIADRVNDSIRTVDVDGGFTLTLASGFDGPGGMALDGGLLFVADTFNHTIKSVDVDSGVVNLVAGQAGVAGSVDGELGIATLDSPQALALVDRTLLVAGFDGAVRAIDLDQGTVATIATGAGYFAPFLEDGDGVLAADLDGAVVRIGLDGTIDHLAGPRAPVGFADGDGVDARFALPACVVIDGDAAIVSDGDNAAIRRVDLATGAVTTLLGHPDFPGDTDGPRQDARLAFPAGLARADDGDLLIVDNGAGTLRRLDVATDTVTTVATGLDDPWEVAVVDADRAVVVEAAAGRLSVVALGDGTVTPLATDLAFPVGVAVIDDRVFVSENEGHTIVEVALADGTVTTFLGTAGFQGSADGDAAVALLNFPAGLDARIEDGAPVLYVAETGGQTIRRVDVASRESRFVVGDPFLSGALPAGSRVALDGAPILNPNDVAVLDGVGGSDVVIVGDTTVVVARP
jgi:hypothetical protein